MFTKKAVAAASLLVVMGGTAACGGSSSSGSSTSADGPTDAKKSDFCATFQNLGNNTTPKQASAAFQKTGTPSDIPAGARHGFEVLVEHLATMADNAQASDLTNMEKNLNATDQKDVLAFVAYLTKQCVPTGSSSVPSAPSS